MFKIEQIPAQFMAKLPLTQVSVLEEVHVCRLNRLSFSRTDLTGKAHTIQFASFVMQQLLQNGVKLNSLDMRISMPVVEFAWMRWIGMDTRQAQWSSCSSTAFLPFPDLTFAAVARNL